MIKPRKHEYMIVHELDDEILLYDPSVDKSHRLNASATFIWQHCDGDHSPEEIARLLTEYYEVDYDSALHDAQKTIQKMVKQEIVEKLPAKQLSDGFFV